MAPIIIPPMPILLSFATATIPITNTPPPNHISGAIFMGRGMNKITMPIMIESNPTVSGALKLM